jgi:hypothetical protein
MPPAHRPRRLSHHASISTGRLNWRKGDVRTFFMNLRAVSRMSSDMVAENIITWIFLGHLMYSFCTMLRMSAKHNSLQHLFVSWYTSAGHRLDDDEQTKMNSH